MRVASNRKWLMMARVQYFKDSMVKEMENGCVDVHCTACTFSKHFLHLSAQKSLHPHLCSHTSMHAHYWFANQGHNPHIPRFSFEIDEKSNSINFYPFWTDLIHFGQI